MILFWDDGVYVNGHLWGDTEGPIKSSTFRIFSIGSLALIPMCNAVQGGLADMLSCLTWGGTLFTAHLGALFLHGMFLGWIEHTESVNFLFFSNCIQLDHFTKTLMWLWTLVYSTSICFRWGESRLSIDSLSIHNPSLCSRRCSKINIFKDFRLNMCLIFVIPLLLVSED